MVYGLKSPKLKHNHDEMSNVIKLIAQRTIKLTIKLQILKKIANKKKTKKN